MKNLSLSLLLLTLISRVNVTPISPAWAIQPPTGGKAHFVKSPRLVDSHTTFSGVRVRQAVYYFDLEIPDDAVASLQKISFAQRQGADKIEFRLPQTKAFLGNHHRKQEPITLADVTEDDSTNAINVTLATPIKPGSQLTVGLKPRRNPKLEGFYLFGVTVFPAGEQPTGLYLGVARFYFFKGSDSSRD